MRGIHLSCHPVGTVCQLPKRQMLLGRKVADLDGEEHLHPPASTRARSTGERMSSRGSRGMSSMMAFRRSTSVVSRASGSFQPGDLARSPCGSASTACPGERARFPGSDRCFSVPSGSAPVLSVSREYPFHLVLLFHLRTLVSCAKSRGRAPKLVFAGSRPVARSIDNK